MRRTGTLSPPCSTNTFCDAGNGPIAGSSPIGSFHTGSLLPMSLSLPRHYPGQVLGSHAAVPLSLEGPKLPRLWLGVDAPYDVDMAGASARSPPALRVPRLRPRAARPRRDHPQR